MKLGLKQDEVRLEEFDPKWHEELISVKNDILQNVQMEEHRIQHIGSTAIKGMMAKPIIDILMGIDDLSMAEEVFFQKLKKAGFLRLRIQRPEEIVLARFTDETYQVKTHFIHLVQYGGELWNNLIFFRDFLNANEAARKEYLQVKLDYVKNKSTGINEYTDYKEAFVKSIFAKRRS